MSNIEKLILLIERAKYCYKGLPKGVYEVDINDLLFAFEIVIGELIDQQDAIVRLEKMIAEGEVNE